MELKTLFSPAKIGNVQIKNRIVRSATFERRATKYGFVGDELINFYTELAQGGTGLIISGFMAVDPSGTASPYQARLDNDEYIPGQKKLVDAVHEFSDVKIAAQIAHTGRLGVHSKYPPIAPSSVFAEYTGLTPRELKADEIKEYVKKFVDTSRRAYESGYDMIQLHAAHGYFLCNFISPFTNKRTDEYGGSILKMAKILIDLYQGVRDELGKNFPITIKLQTQDFFPGGLELNEGMEIAKILAEVGYDAIEPSGGGSETMIGKNDTYPSLRVKSPEDENYFLPAAKKLRPILKDCALMLMGGIKNPISAEKLLQEKVCDFISMCRPLIYEPDLPNRWMNGDTSPAKCISCNSCYMTMVKGPVYCVVRKKLEDKRKRKEKKDTQKN